jgi:hypothetical protein
VSQRLAGACFQRAAALQDQVRRFEGSPTHASLPAENLPLIPDYSISGWAVTCQMAGLPMSIDRLLCPGWYPTADKLKRCRAKNPAS